MSDASQRVVCPNCAATNRLPSMRPARQAKCGRCHEPLFNGKPLGVDTPGFERHVGRSDILVLADFWAPWCGPCNAMAPAFERAAAELEPEYRHLKVDVDQEHALARQYGVSGIPTLILFSGGRPVARSAGAMGTAGIVKWAHAHAPSVSSRQGSGT